MGFTTSAVKGAGWHTAFKVGAAGLTILKLTLLGRFLGPYAFGLYSLTTIALGLMEAATETGINVLLVQSSKPIKYFIDTAWVIAIVRGIVIGSVMVLLAFGLSNFYQENALFYLILTAALIPVIKGFINPAITTYHKNLNFFSDSLYRLSLVLVESVVVVALAWYTRSPFSFILAMIVAAVYEVCLSFILFKDKPKFIFTYLKAKEILSYSKGLTIATLFDYLHENLDNLIIGKQFSTAVVGLYQNAYGFGHKVTLDLTQSAYHSTMPIYGQLHSDVSRLKRAFIRTNLTTLASVSLFALPFLLYPQILTLILGPEWESAVVLVVPLTLAGLVQSIALLQYGLFITTKSYGWLNLHKVVSVIVLVVSLLFLTADKSIAEVAWLIFWGRLAVLPLALLGTQMVFTSQKSRR